MPTRRNAPELKLLYGVEPRKLETTSPTPPKREPQPLPWFTLRERAIWDEVVAELRDMGALTSADRYTIASYCSSIAHMEMAAQQLSADPSYTMLTRYSITTNPLVRAYDLFIKRVESLARQLGLTPAVRATMHGRQPERKADNEADHVADLYA